MPRSVIATATAAVLALTAAPAGADPFISPELSVDAPAFGVVPGDQTFPAVAYGGGQYLVVWDDARGPTWANLYAARVSRQGTILDPAGIFIMDDASLEHPAAVASDGTDFLVVLEWFAMACASRVTATGVVLDQSCVPLSTANSLQQAPAVAFDGTNYLAVWQDNRNGDNDVYATRVGPGATVLDPAGIAISTGTGAQQSPGAASAGDGWFVVWEDARGGSPRVYGSRVGATGTVLDAAGIPLSSGSYPASTPVIASAAGGYFVSWTEARGGTSVLCGSRVSAAGAVLDPAGVDLAPAAASVTSPRIAANAAGYVVAFNDRGHANGRDVGLVAVSQAGAVTGSSGLQATPSTFWDVVPAVAGDGTGWLAVWQGAVSDYDIGGTRLAADLTQLDTPPLVVDGAALGEDRPAVAFDGTHFMVVWSISDGSGNVDIRAARVSRGGGVIDAPPIVVAQGVSAGLAPAPTIAFSGGCYLVAWTDDRHDPNYSDIYGARVTVDGVVLDPQSIPISTASGFQCTAAAAGDGAGFLVVWEDQRSSTGIDGDIYAARVTAAGTVLDPAGIPVTVGHNGSGWPAVAYGGGHYLVTWDDDRPGQWVEDVYAARVGLDGTVLDPTGVAVGAATGAQFGAAPAFDGSEFFVVWSDERAGSSTEQIYGSRVATDLTVLDPAGLPIDTIGNQEEGPTLAFDGSHYMAFWLSAGSGYDTPTTLCGSELHPDGTLVEWYPLNVSRERGGQYSPQVASDGAGHTLLAYTRFPISPTENAPRIYVRVIASSCATDSACPSGHCADGVCCDGACTGTCMACTVAGRVGMCSPVPAGSPDPVATTPCTGSSACDGAGGCKRANGFGCTTSTQCATGLCVNGVCCATACNDPCQVCGGGGICGGCPSSSFCDGAACVPRRNLGGTCTRSTECQSTYCVDGVCCDAACLGDCQRCGASGHCATLQCDAGAPPTDGARPGDGGAPGDGATPGQSDGATPGHEDAGASSGGDGGPSRADGGQPQGQDAGGSSGGRYGGCGCRAPAAGTHLGLLSGALPWLLCLRRRRR